MTNFDFETYFSQCRERVDEKLQYFLSFPESRCSLLTEAMRYATLNGGKRVRPLLIYATAEALGANKSAADLAACAVELVHSYSLVHDDLPAMDDDDLRRGQPTCHIKYDEATAILAGDALQSYAFELLADGEAPHLDASDRLQLIQALAYASGTSGMAAGQSLDLQAEGKDLTLQELENIHVHKTGKLITAAVKMGAICAKTTDDQILKALDLYSSAIGLAFQVQDDILDIISDTDTLGKPQGADLQLAKATYPAILGLNEAKQKASELYENAIDALTCLNHRAEPLRALAKYIVTRNH